MCQTTTHSAVSRNALNDNTLTKSHFFRPYAGEIIFCHNDGSDAAVYSILMRAYTYLYIWCSMAQRNFL